ncbi:Retrovirus-related Pol polyprotein from transposon RE1 [Vitis vinifera]|uniref:Retrovirus-related Pol polyprotein from transposon RE1 n=1 Tax=Vitis vinifera TaxID=29760 RepID=A0A438IQS5_VITVI|nr:Retrovirus-related Pol polyprotein from transposon RE1 [Vitis vinifera]
MSTSQIPKLHDGTLHHALFLHKDSPLRLHAYSNADWASNPNDRSSTSAHVVFLGPNVISCSSKKQKFIARFSTKAEYRVVSSTTVEVLWIKSLLLELSIDVRSALPTYYDNVGPGTMKRSGLDNGVTNSKEYMLGNSDLGWVGSAVSF